MNCRESKATSVNYSYTEKNLFCYINYFINYAKTDIATAKEFCLTH